MYIYNIHTPLCVYMYIFNIHPLVHTIYIPLYICDMHTMYIKRIYSVYNVYFSVYNGYIKPLSAPFQCVYIASLCVYSNFLYIYILFSTYDPFLLFTYTSVSIFGINCHSPCSFYPTLGLWMKMSVLCLIFSVSCFHYRTFVPIITIMSLIIYFVSCDITVLRRIWSFSRIADNYLHSKPSCLCRVARNCQEIDSNYEYLI